VSARTGRAGVAGLSLSSTEALRGRGASPFSARIGGRILSADMCSPGTVKARVRSSGRPETMRGCSGIILLRRIPEPGTDLPEGRIAGRD